MAVQQTTTDIKKTTGGLMPFLRDTKNELNNFQNSFKTKFIKCLHSRCYSCHSVCSLCSLDH